MPLEPVKDYVLIAVDAPPDYATYMGFSHLVVPEGYRYGPKDRAVVGVVLKKGPACRDVSVHLHDKVVVEKYRGAYTDATRSAMLVREDDILAVVNGH